MNDTEYKAVAAVRMRLLGVHPSRVKKLLSNNTRQTVETWLEARERYNDFTDGMWDWLVRPDPESES